MIKAHIDENGYFTGKWTSIGSMEGTVEADKIPVDNDKKRLHSYKYENGTWVFDEERYRRLIDEEKKSHRAENAAAEIQDLKGRLAATDYQIIKCYECSLAGIPLPYDIASLHDERQTVRDRINKLENLTERRRCE